MDEYIKREDALDAVLFALVGTGLQSRALNAIHEVDTADVAPKTEVAREIFEEIEKICTDFPLYGNQDTIILSEHDFAELKKKYTEGK